MDRGEAGSRRAVAALGSLVLIVGITAGCEAGGEDQAAPPSTSGETALLTYGDTVRLEVPHLDSGPVLGLVSRRGPEQCPMVVTREGESRFLVVPPDSIETVQRLEPAPAPAGAEQDSRWVPWGVDRMKEQIDACEWPDR